MNAAANVIDNMRYNVTQWHVGLLFVPIGAPQLLQTILISGGSGLLGFIRVFAADGPWSVCIARLAILAL